MSYSPESLRCRARNGLTERKIVRRVIVIDQSREHSLRQQNELGARGGSVHRHLFGAMEIRGAIRGDTRYKQCCFQGYSPLVLKERTAAIARRACWP